MQRPDRILDRVPLAPLTTLELGGEARHLIEARDAGDVVTALRWARGSGLAAAVLGGGSNLVVADEGFDGLVVRMVQRGVEVRPEGNRVLVTAQAGEPWDALVARTVDERLAGLECLSGIPGLAGATPIQNVGAYGQEVSETIARVRVLDRRTLETRDLTPDACAFAYRDSAFKRAPDRWVVLSVTFALRPEGAPSVRYAELARALDVQPDGPAPPLGRVRETVIALRRGKSMVIDAADSNRRSAGSFFTNPIVTEQEAARVVAHAVSLGIVADASSVPRWPAPGGVKLAAGWLIERSDITKGLRRGAVGISSRHALALVHHGGGTSRALLDLALEVREAVRARFGVVLRPEPVLLGIAGDHPLLAPA